MLFRISIYYRIIQCSVESSKYIYIIFFFNLETYRTLYCIVNIYPNLTHKGLQYIKIAESRKEMDIQT